VDTGQLWRARTLDRHTAALPHQPGNTHRQYRQIYGPHRPPTVTIYSNLYIVLTKRIRILCTTNAVITTAIRLRSDYDVSRTPASIRREQKMNMSTFRCSRVVVVSQSS